MAQLKLTNVYCIDASSLIDLNRWYPKNMKFFLPIWDKIENMIKDEELISHIEVHREIEKGDDKLVEWCNQNKNMFLDVDDEQIKNFHKVKKKYDLSYWNKEINKIGAWSDPWIIALSISHGTKIITNENKTKPNKIPTIAKEFRIFSLNLLEFFSEIGIK